MRSYLSLRNNSLVLPEFKHPRGYFAGQAAAQRLRRLLPAGLHPAVPKASRPGWDWPTLTGSIPRVGKKSLLVSRSLADTSGDTRPRTRIAAGFILYNEAGLRRNR